MKKSHRKDVIIARVIFAFLVLAVLLLVVFGVKALVKYVGAHDNTERVETQTQETETEYVVKPLSTEDPADAWLVDETETETETETVAYHTLRADYGINLRAEPNTNCEIYAKVTEGETVLLLEDNGDGWGKVQYKDKTGYMKLEYLTDLGVAEETE